MQIVYVKWRDAYLNEGWHNKAGIDHVKGESVWVVESIGWLIDQNGDRLIICGSTSSNGSCSEILKIPMEAVVEWQLLTPPNPENEGQITEGSTPFDTRLPTLRHTETIRS